MVSGYVNSPYTIKITIMTITHQMEVTGNCCAFIVTKMNMPVTRLPMPMQLSLAMKPRTIALAIIHLRN